MKIVVWDLEIIPDLNAALRVWPQLSNYPGLTLRASITSICSFGYWVLGESAGPRIINAWDFKKAWKKDVNDDKPLLREAYEILKDADLIITQNGRKFDLPYIQTRLAKAKLKSLPKGLIHFDTKKVAKENLYLFSNSLDHMAQFFEVDQKLDHEGWPLWVKVHGGIPRVRDRAAEQLMSKYCLRDVRATKRTFEKLRKFGKLPNYNMFNMNFKNCCPNCESTRIQKRGYHYTNTNSFHRYACMQCGSWFRTNANDKQPRAL